MKRKLIDVARRAGVGHATVDRVLNERGGVRPETAKRVLDAARDLGFDRKLPTLYRKVCASRCCWGDGRCRSAPD